MNHVVVVVVVAVVDQFDLDDEFEAFLEKILVIHFLRKKKNQEEHLEFQRKNFDDSFLLENRELF